MLLEIALNAGIVVLEGALASCRHAASPRRAFGPNARHVGPFYGASVYSCSL